ncbi:murein hydrolase activator EnvC family protein [Coprococcus sp. AF21-14LB]|uniref:murein hydrolase activator EnvC family protein n=1 Tax=Coprococcus sp. AF21-14LB TaxID=2292231 RepID=UPI000E4706FD|nr:M23 family metallopeptidase [Coprococcus sp. AF21-14LB]RGS82616.1 peptidase M23 [Coprococcus sp. AF21-14LB]
MKKRYRKTAALLLAGLLSMGSVLQAGATDTQIDAAQKEKEQLEQQKQAAEQEQNALSEQLNSIIAQMQETNAKVDQKAVEIEQAENDLINAKIDENNQYESMKKRIRFMYENGGGELLEILFTSDSMAELLNKAEYISKITEYDRNMLVEFQKIVTEVQEKEAALKAEYEELGALQAQLGEQQTQVQTLLDSKGIEIANLESAIGAKASELQALIEKARAEEEARKQAELAQQQQQKPSGGNSSSGNNSSGGSYVPPGDNVISGNGTFAHPCPSGYLTSGFGYRDFDNSFHKGVDFGTGGAAVPTYAAADGRVLIAGWSNSAGNWVVIQHSGGLVTKYMHHSALSVSSGQYVSKGQQLGLTGNTGNSAGVHLHFQVELNGRPVDPFNYLS